MKKFVVYGPPGTGKTTTLMNVLEVVLKKYSPEEVAFVSFTRKGAYEGRDRAMEKFGFSEKKFPYFRTLHSIAFREVGARKENMLNWRDYRFFSKQMGMQFLGYYTEELIHNDDQYLFYDVLKRNNPVQADRMAGGMDRYKCEYVSDNYRKFKKEYGKFDFTDLIEKYVAEGAPLPVKVAIVDEAQDLSTLQWAMVDKAFSNVEVLYIAGDDDQAIYEWSGADVGRFLAQPGERSTLQIGYRLPYTVHNVAIQIANQIKTRQEKPFSFTSETGSVKFYNSVKEIELTREGSWMCLARNNCFLVSRYDKEFRDRKLIYKLRGESSIDNSDLRQIAMYEKVRKTGLPPDKETQIALRRVCGENTNWSFPWYFSFEWPKEKKLYYQDVLQHGIRDEFRYNNVNISTIHGVKGGEADNVVLVLDVTKSINEACETNRDAELRCLYVAVTRARKNLHIVLSAEKQSAYDKILQGVRQ